MNRRLFAAFVAVIVGASSLVAQTNGQEIRKDASSKINVPNFGCINDSYYRGAQPQKGDYADLAALGIKAVIDVHRRGPKDEQRLAEAAGMKFFRIPLDENDVPTAAQVEEFLRIVSDPANGPVFVHCAGGRHRTGALTAVYRMKHEGWTADQAFDEMKRYEFLKDGDHSALKEFVFDYYGRLASNSAAASGAK